MGFIVAIAGMAFVLVPLSRVLAFPDFLVSTIGFAFVLVGIFFAVESAAKSK